MENKNNSKSARRKLFFTRCGIFAILLLMLLPMLCSFTYPLTILISNYDSIGYGGMILLNGVAVTFGEHVVDTSENVIVSINGGTCSIPADSISFPLTNTDIPDGTYSLEYQVVSTAYDGYSIFPVEGTYDYSGNGLFEDLNVFIYVGDVNHLTVASGDVGVNDDPNAIWILSPAPTATDSITDVWTGITDWIIDSLSTVQGVFVSRGSGVMLNDYLDMSNTITYDGYTLAYANYQTLPQGDLYYGQQNLGVDADNLTYSQVTIDGIVYEAGFVDGIPTTMTNIQTGFYFNTALDLSIGAPAGGYELTLLGTLAVIGVSIGICFLLIGVIQRFLKLRG